MNAPTTIGIDIGGTNLRAGVVDCSGTLIDTLAVSTPRVGTEAEAAIVELVRDLRARHDVRAVGLAVAGFLDPECEIVRFAPHLPWRDAPLRKTLTDSLGLPVRLEHDANAAAWGEYRYGAGKGSDTWVFLAVGTGIGATLMVDGKIYRGAYGTAPEFGHLTVVPGRSGRPCSCGKKGCLERYASGTALVDTARELAPAFPASVLGMTLSAGRQVSGADVVSQAREGDELAEAVIENFAQWLGLGLSFVADLLDPELIVLGGGVAADADLYLDEAREVMAESMVGSGHRPTPRVATAVLGGSAGMIGAADLARLTLPGATAV